jgi:hypothetical protein
MGGRDFNKNIISAEDSKSDFRTHGMDSEPNKEKPMSFKRDPIQATTDKAHDMGTALLQKLAGIRKK